MRPIAELHAELHCASSNNVDNLSCEEPCLLVFDMIGIMSLRVELRAGSLCVIRAGNGLCCSCMLCSDKDSEVLVSLHIFTFSSLLLLYLADLSKYTFT